VDEYFKDYDQLRTGAVSKAQFRRCLAQLGLSKLGKHDLTEAQFQMLMNHYQNPKKDDQILWNKFMYDVETGVICICP